MENNKVFNNKRKISFILLFSMFLNIFTPFGVLLREGYAESRSENAEPVELFDEYYPKSSVGNPKNWFVNSWKDGYEYNGGSLKLGGQTNTLLEIYDYKNRKLGSTIYPLNNGLKFNFRKHIDKTPAEVYLMSKKEFKKDELYEFRFKNEKEGDYQNLNFRLVTLKAGGKGRDNVKLESENIKKYNNEPDNSWSHIKEGNIRVTFLGTGEKQGFGFSMQGATDALTRYELRNFSLKNITPASKPVVESDGLVGDSVVSGKVVKDSGDKRSNFEGDIVHVLVNGQEVGTALVDKNNNWKYDLKEPIKKGDKLGFYVQHPESNKASETVEHPYKKELHKPEIKEAVEGEKKVTGTGVPGDEIIIKDKDGNILGSDEVDENGNFEIELSRPLNPKEEITLTPETEIGNDKKIGDSTKITPGYNPEAHKPEIKEAVEGENKVTGEGVPGDEIIIKDKEGNELGKGKVDENGNFEIDLDEPLKPGDTITATPKTGDKEGTESDEKTLDYNPEAHKPEIKEAVEGENKVTGEGVPGDEIIIKDKDGNKLGKGKVDKDGRFEIDLDEPLKEGDEIIAVPKTGDKEGTESDEKEIKYDPDYHKPEIEDAKSGEKKVTGEGVPGDEIIITDAEGNKLGDSIVKEDGTFEVDVNRPLKKGEEINGYTKTGENESTETEVTVTYEAKNHKPEITEANDNEKKVTGKGIPGDKIVITDEEGKELGRGEVDKDGNFTVELDRPLRGGEEITATPITGNNKGHSDSKIIEYNKDEHKVEITEAREGEKKVEGKGTPGDEVIITDEGGNELGKGKVDKDGNFHVNLNRPLKPGEKITATPETNGNKGVPSEKEVDYIPERHKPEITEANDNEKKVKGKGIPGDEIIITDKDGKELGRGKVDKDGNFEVDLNRPLKSGETVTASPGTKIGNEVKKGTSSEKEVEYDPEAHIPEITEANDNEEKVKGEGIPGDKIIITDEEGNEIGRGEIGEDGKFEVKTDRPLKSGEKITATPETNGNKGKSSEKEVNYDPKAHKPDISEAKEGQKVVKGEGVPGDKIIITDEKGNELGTGSVDENGNFEVGINRPLVEGEEIGAVAKTGENESEETNVTVTYEAKAHKPEITEAKDNEEVVKGTGMAGDEIIITDEKGNELGSGKVDKDGNFEVKTDRPLKAGEVVTATPITGNNKGESSEKEVTYDPKAHKPEITEAKDSTDLVKGQGVPGDQIILTDEEGKELGRAIVDKKGNFEIRTNRLLISEEMIYALAETEIADKTIQGEKSEKEVTYDPKAHKPDISEAKEGEKVVKGKGIPGDEIIITDEKGNELGTGSVDENGNFEVKINRPLVEREEIGAVAKTGDNESEETNVTVTYEAKAHKPEITEAKDNEEVVKGKGVPGDEIIITDEKGNELGSGKVDKDGNFEVKTDRPLKAGETVTATPITGNNKGESSEKEVTYDPKAHKPEITEAKEGEEVVKGKGVPGDEIIITDEEGNELGRGKVDKDGKFEVEINRPLEKGENIVAIPKTDGKTGESGDKKVDYNPKAHKPEITEAKEGKKVVKGEGIPDDEIIITDEKGKELGRGKVGKDGKFEVGINRPLEEGETITATPETNGKKGSPAEKEIKYDSEAHKPEIKEVKEGDKVVNGKGFPGDEIIITDEEGNELGRGKVGEDGKFEVGINRPLEEGEKVIAIPETSGNKGTPSEEKEAEYDPELHKPEIREAKEGEKLVKGEGFPGDEIVITDEEGNELGRGKVDENGNFEVETNRPLVEGEEIGAIAKTGENESEETNVTVTYESSKHKPKVDPAEEGEKLVKGEGFPGDEIIITDEEGNELGRGKVGEDGKFEIEINRPLKGGEEITATPITGNNKGESGEVEVKKKQVIVPETDIPVEEDKDDSKEDKDKDKPIVDEDKHKPEMEEINHDDKIIGGKATPGDEIVIIDKDGKEIGRTQVDKNGNFKVELKRPAKEGEELLVKVIRDGKEITEIILIVNPKGVSVYDKLNSEDHIAYIQGFEDATVRPEDPVTREEVSAVLYRLLKPSYRDTIKTTKTSFKDVSPKRWSRKHIGTLENGNIINGTGYGNFSPARNITKAELVTMLSRLERLDTRPNDQFTDIKGHWAEAEIKSAANKGWINGHGNNKFQPDKHLTRAEFVTMINNVLNRKVEKKDILPEAKGFKDLKKDKWYYEAMMEAINSHHYERKNNGFEKWTKIYYPNLDM